MCYSNSSFECVEVLRYISIIWSIAGTLPMVGGHGDPGSGTVATG